MTNLVSIIIPTRNSGRTLKNCLNSLRRQTYQNLEIIVIDSNSKDDTITIAEEFKTKICTIDGERTRAKNFATETAKGDYLLFLDSDMILQSTVVEECVTAMRSNGVGGVIIPEKTIGSGFWARVRDFERKFYHGTKVESARFFRKSDVLKVGGYDEDIITYEESTLPQKLEKKGMKVDVRILSFILHDEGKLNLRKWLRKKYYYSRTMRTYKERYSEYSIYQIGIYHRLRIFTQNGKWMELVKCPHLTAGLFVLKSLEFISSKFR